MAKNLSVPVLRTEDYEGSEVKIYRSELVPMNQDSIKILGGDPWYDEGDSWLVEWWEGHGQDAVVDVYVVYKDSPEDYGDGFPVANPETTEEYEEVLRLLRKGQWVWLLETMGDWDLEELAEEAGVQYDLE